jgi:hypothetical protein
VIISCVGGFCVVACCGGFGSNNSMMNKWWKVSPIATTRSAAEENPRRLSRIESMSMNVIGVHPKYATPGLFIFTTLLGFLFFGIVSAGISSMKQRASVSIETSIFRAEELKFPFVTVCSLWFVDPGLQQSWFSDITTSYFDEDLP